MIKIIKLTDPECLDCMSASFGDCATGSTKTTEIPMCMDCEYKADNVMRREKLLCRKLHAWVEPTDFCAWGREEVK